MFASAVVVASLRPICRTKKWKKKEEEKTSKLLLLFPLYKHDQNFGVYKYSIIGMGRFIAFYLIMQKKKHSSPVYSPIRNHFNWFLSDLFRLRSPLLFFSLALSRSLSQIWLCDVCECGASEMLKTVAIRNKITPTQWGDEAADFQRLSELYIYT